MAANPLILLVDDHPVVRTGKQGVPRDYSDLTLIGEAANGRAIQPGAIDAAVG